MAAPRTEPGTSGSAARNSDHRGETTKKMKKRIRDKKLKKNKGKNNYWSKIRPENSRSISLADFLMLNT
jgi:hypothetical protein